MRRRHVRECALQSLFQIHVGEVSPAEAMQHVLEETGRDLDLEYFHTLVTGTYEHLAAVDDLIRQYSVGWELERMPAVDLTILRLAVYEMLYTDTPPKVVINEAVELAKAFSTAESGRFVNGILGKMLFDLDRLRGTVRP